MAPDVPAPLLPMHEASMTTSRDEPAAWALP
jgi:hypothetical protein